MAAIPTIGDAGGEVTTAGHTTVHRSGSGYYWDLIRYFTRPV